MDQQTLFDKHSFSNEAVFHLKVFALSWQRRANNFVNPVPKTKNDIKLAKLPVVATSESLLWNIDDSADNWILTAGKIQNLRVAAKKINGVEVDAGKVFSFWKCVGKPSKLKGYVLGREVREGCVVPTIAGGLCQLSNALYDAALKAGFDIIERHRHSKIIKGSLAERNRDATVKWNYIDLRFSSATAFRIEVEITADKLIVNFRSSTEVIESRFVFTDDNRASKLNDCYACGNFECFKHPNPDTNLKPGAITTYILDEKWNEFDSYIKERTTDQDIFILPLHQNKIISSARYNLTISKLNNIKLLPLVFIRRSIGLRVSKKTNLFKLMLGFDERLAKASLKRIPIQSTHLVVSQNLLPFLYENGAMGGRTFDVLMYRLPLEQLHQTLNNAHAKHTQSATLNDFRASAHLIELENVALTKCKHIITPHKQIAGIFANKVIKLDWIIPPHLITQIKGNKVLFPASALGRKGAYEVRDLAIHFNFTVVVAGNATECADFWNGVKAETPGSNLFDGIALVIYPAYVEHRPLALLKAIAAGIPVITTEACGLMPAENLTILPVGDFELLKRAVNKHFNNQ